MSHGGAPPWVYHREMSNMQSSHYQETTLLNDKIKRLEEENANLKEENRLLGEKVKELEHKLEV